MSHPDPQHDAENERADDDLLRAEEDARHCDEYAEHREVIHPVCSHTERPNALSLQSIGNPFMCHECFDLRFKNLKFPRHQPEAWERGNYGPDIGIDGSHGYRERQYNAQIRANMEYSQRTKERR